MIASLLALAVALAAWWIARTTASRRALAIGGFPPALLLGLGAAGRLAAEAQAPPAALAALACSAVAAVVDLRTGLIFDSLTAALFAAAIALAVAAGTSFTALTGAAVAGGALGTLYLLTRGRGIGFGDVKLAAGLGAALGWHAGLDAIGVAFVFGGAYGALLLLARRASRDTAIRFGPFLAAGTCVAVLLPGRLP